MAATTSSPHSKRRSAHCSPSWARRPTTSATPSSIPVTRCRSMPWPPRSCHGSTGISARSRAPLPGPARPRQRERDLTLTARLMVSNDGQAFKYMGGDVRAPNVLNNLIYRREIPVMIAVFINPGRGPDQPEPTPQNWGDRDTNRPAEYNSLDDKYARVIVDELMPALSRDYSISNDPERP